MSNSSHESSSELVEVELAVTPEESERLRAVEFETRKDKDGGAMPSGSDLAEFITRMAISIVGAYETEVGRLAPSISPYDDLAKTERERGQELLRNQFVDWLRHG